MGSISSSRRKSYRYAGRDNVRRNEEKSMQNTNAYVATQEREESPNEGKAAQQLEHILASGLPSLHRRAYRILGNPADAEDAVQDALLAPIPTCTSSEGRHRSLLGLRPSCLTALDCSYAGG